MVLPRTVEEVQRATELCRDRLGVSDDSEPSGSVGDEVQESLRRIDKILRPELKE